MRIAACKKCNERTWVNYCTLGGRAMGEYCADCFDVVGHDTPDRAVRFASSSGPNHNDPGFDNAVRAMEDYSSHES